MSKLATTEGAMSEATREMQKAESECAQLRTMNAEFLKAALAALWFLQNGEIHTNGERHPFSIWCETVLALRRVIGGNGQNSVQGTNEARANLRKSGAKSEHHLVRPKQQTRHLNWDVPPPH